MTKTIVLAGWLFVIAILTPLGIGRCADCQEESGSQSKSAAEVLVYILAQRQQIKNVHVKIESEYTNFGARHKGKSESKAWLQGDNLRVDTRFLDREKEFEQVPVSVCLFGYQGMHVHFGLGLNRSGILLVSDPKTTTLREGNWLTPDPRFLGLIPDSWLGSGSVDYQSYYNPDNSECSVESTDEMYKGCAVSKLAFKCKRHALSIKFVKELNYAVRSMRFVHESGLMVNEIVSELKEFPVQEIWFPASTAFVSNVNNAPSRSEELTVEADFSTEIEDRVFSIKGMEFVKPGTPVNWHGPIREDKMHPLAWDGNDIIHVEENGGKKESGSNSGDSESTNPSGILFIAGACLLGIGAAVILLKSWRTKEVAIK